MPKASNLVQMMAEILQQKGAYGAKRLQRAADEIPNLEKHYTDEALRAAFLGDNAKAVATMKPGDFAKFALHLPPGDRQKYIDYLASLKGFDDVPFLEVGKPAGKPRIEGHEGRHRSLALSQKGEPTSLVRVLPKSSLREPLPRRSQEEFIEALRDELGDGLVIPEGGGPAIQLPDLYKAGGAVGMAGGGKAAKAVSEMAAELLAKAPSVNRIDMNYKDVTKRVPELTEAAKRVKLGEMSPEKYAELVNNLKPVKPYDFVPKPATADEAIGALTSNKKAMYGKGKEIKQGERADLRLDIPAYSQHGVWVNSIHRKDAPTVYDSVSSVTDAVMVPSADKALKVATGDTPKAPFAVIRGDWNPVSEEEAVAKAQQYLGDPEWRQVGYDPERHGYFYDRETMAPIVAADEVLQIGPLVIARNPKYGDTKDFPFKEGGVVRMADAGSVDEAIKAAVRAGAERKPLAKSQPVDIEQMRRDIEDAVVQTAALKDQRAKEKERRIEPNYSPLLSYLPKGTPESVRFALDKAARNIGPSMQVINIDGKPVDVVSNPENILSVAGEVLDIPSSIAGEEIYRATESPLAAAVAYTLTDPIGMVMGAPKVAANAVKASKPLFRFAGKAIDNAMQTGQGPLAGGLSAIMPRRIDVYHGSPYLFPPTEKNPLGEFDAKKIGSGEGAQAYGYGHYLAESPKVAMDYRNRLSSAGSDYTYSWKGKVYDAKSGPESHALSLAFHDGPKTAKSIAADGLTAAQKGEPWAMEMGGVEYWQKMLDTANQIRRKGEVKGATGSLYRVDLPDEHVARMLDWDKPLSQQPESVRETLTRLADIAQKPKKNIGVRNREGVRSLSDAIKGDDAYFNLGGYHNAAQTSQMFSKAGIPGIRYLDGDSRAIGKGSSNYVIFPGNEDILTIKERMRDGGLAHHKNESE